MSGNRINNSDILELIQQGHKTQAEINATVVGKISSMTNEFVDMKKGFVEMKTEFVVFKTETSNALENNDKTNEKGAINRISDIEKDVASIKIQRKVAYGVVTLFIFIGGGILKLIGFFKS